VPTLWQAKFSGAFGFSLDAIKHWEGRAEDLTVRFREDQEDNEIVTKVFSEIWIWTVGRVERVRHVHWKIPTKTRADGNCRQWANGAASNRRI